MPEDEKDTAARNSMIDVFVKSGDVGSAGRLFDGMEHKNVISHSPCFRSSSPGRARFNPARSQSSASCPQSIDDSPNVANALMDMYFKCCDTEQAMQIFASIEIKETAFWNIAINDLTINGRSMEALGIFSEIANSGTPLNEVTMLGVLSACAHVGLVEDGKMRFEKMGELGVKRRIGHYGCMVDILGRGGRLEEAERG